MNSPKHLWAGDWQRESAAAAAERADRQVQPPQPTPPPAPPRRPSLYARAVAWLRGLRGHLAALRLPRPPRLRLALLVALAALVVAGSAYGLSSLGGSGDSGSAAVGGQPAWLGLQMASFPSGAVVIVDVAPGGPAASAGLHAGDVITQFDGHPVVAPINVTADVSARSPGQTVEIQVARGSMTYTTRVTLIARPAGYP